MNIFFIIGIVVFNFILQSTILKYLSINGITPNTSLIIVSIFALLAGKKTGSIVGVIAGLLQDVFFGSVIGINTLIYFSLGYCIGILDNKVFKENLILPVTTIIIATFSYNLMYYLFMVFLSVDISFTIMFKNILIKEVIYNCLLSMFIYKKMLKYYRAPRINFTNKHN